jgi:hypothetical protein
MPAKCPDTAREFIILHPDMHHNQVADALNISAGSARCYRAFLVREGAVPPLPFPSRHPVPCHTPKSKRQLNYAQVYAMAQSGMTHAAISKVIGRSRAAVGYALLRYAQETGYTVRTPSAIAPAPTCGATWPPRGVVADAAFLTSYIWVKDAGISY